MYKHGPDALLDDVGKDRERGWQASISVREDVSVGAFGPVNVSGGMDHFLDICTVEVDGPRLEIGERAWET